MKEAEYVMPYLLHYKADLDAKDAEGKRPVDYCEVGSRCWSLLISETEAKVFGEIVGELEKGDEAIKEFERKRI
jgi:hypothetical protein